MSEWNNKFNRCAVQLSFAADSRIAWAHITIPEVVMTGGETVAEWYPLNGRLGDGKEGTVQIILSLTVSRFLSRYYSDLFDIILLFIISLLFCSVIIILSLNSLPWRYL